MKSSKLRLIPLAVGLALVSGIVPGAMAKSTSARQSNSRTVQTHSIRSTVSLDWFKRVNAFKGGVGFVSQEVSPDEALCMEERRVALFKITRRGAVKLDGMTTGFGGEFAFRFNQPQTGTFEVRVAPTTFSDQYGDLIECSGAKDSMRL